MEAQAHEENDLPFVGALKLNLCEPLPPSM